MTDLLGFIPARAGLSAGAPFVDQNGTFINGTTFFPGTSIGSATFDARGWASILVMMDAATTTTGTVVTVTWFDKATPPGQNILWRHAIATRGDRTAYDVLPVVSGFFQISVFTTGTTVGLLEVIPLATLNHKPKYLNTSTNSGTMLLDVDAVNVAAGLPNQLIRQIDPVTTGTVTVTLATQAEAWTASLQALTETGAHKQWLWLEAGSLAFDGANQNYTRTAKVTLPSWPCDFRFNNQDPITRPVSAGITLDP